MAADLNLKLSHVRMELLPSAGEGVKVSSSAYGSQLWGWAFNVVSVECAAFQDHPNVLARSCRYLSELDPVLSLGCRIAILVAQVSGSVCLAVSDRAERMMGAISWYRYREASPCGFYDGPENSRSRPPHACQPKSKLQMNIPGEGKSLTGCCRQFRRSTL